MSNKIGPLKILQVATFKLLKQRIAGDTGIIPIIHV